MSNGGSGVSEYAGQLQKLLEKKKEKKKENSNSYSFRLVVALRLNFL